MGPEIPSGPATASLETAPTSIVSSSRWREPRGFRHGSKSVFQFQNREEKAQSEATTAGLFSTRTSTTGFRPTFPKRDKHPEMKDYYFGKPHRKPRRLLDRPRLESGPTPGWQATQLFYLPLHRSRRQTAFQSQHGKGVPVCRPRVTCTLQLIRTSSMRASLQAGEKVLSEELAAYFPSRFWPWANMGNLVVTSNRILYEPSVFSRLPRCVFALPRYSRDSAR